MQIIWRNEKVYHSLSLHICLAEYVNFFIFPTHNIRIFVWEIDGYIYIILKWSEMIFKIIILTENFFSESHLLLNEGEKRRLGEKSQWTFSYINNKKLLQKRILSSFKAYVCLFLIMWSTAFIRIRDYFFFFQHSLNRRG